MVEHREYRITQQGKPGGSTPTVEINAWFLSRIKKRPVKEAVEWRANLTATPQITSRGQ